MHAFMATIVDTHDTVTYCLLHVCDQTPYVISLILHF